MGFTTPSGPVSKRGGKSERGRRKSMSTGASDRGMLRGVLYKEKEWDAKYYILLKPKNRGDI